MTARPTPQTRIGVRAWSALAGTTSALSARLCSDIGPDSAADGIAIAVRGKVQPMVTGVRIRAL
jgi:hypothetical protein